MRGITLTEADREDWMALWLEAFPEDSRQWTAWYAENFVREGSILGIREDGRLTSMVHLNRSTLALRGRELPACAVAGVATAQDCRGRGLARTLLDESHRILRREGTALAYLYPFSYAFYEKYGWTAGYRAFSWKLSAAQAVHCGRSDGILQWIERPASEDFAHMARIYREWVKTLDGYRLRDSSDMHQRYEDEAMGGARLAFWESGTSEGYLLASCSEGRWSVADWAGEDMKGLMLALFAEGKVSEAAWLSPLDDAVGIPGAVRTVVDRDMVRVLNFAACLEGIQCPEGLDCVIAAEDPFLPANSGCYRRSEKEGQIHCQREDEAPRAWGDIRAWTAVLMGYAAPETAGLVFAQDKEDTTIAQLQAVFPPRRMWLQEMYV